MELEGDYWMEFIAPPKRRIMVVLSRGFYWENFKIVSMLILLHVGLFYARICKFQLTPSKMFWPLWRRDTFGLLIEWTAPVTYQLWAWALYLRLQVLIAQRHLVLKNHVFEWIKALICEKTEQPFLLCQYWLYSNWPLIRWVWEETHNL